MPRGSGRTALAIGPLAVAAAGALLLAAVACGGVSGGVGGGADGDERDELVVFAAASLEDVLTGVAERFDAASGLAAVFNFAGSNVLARQIEAAGVADVYISANEEWMDYLEARDRLVPGSRRTFLANRLVVVANAGSDLALERLADLAGLDFRYLSLGDPAAVPAGRYARECLAAVEVDGSDLWRRLEAKVAPAADVRAALAMVEARRDVVGIVYSTDAGSSSRVKTLLEVPEPPAPPIRYSAAAIRGGSPRAAELLDFLSGEEAAAVFAAYGFARSPADG